MIDPESRRVRVVRVPASDEDLLEECRVETFRSGGKGGQHQNTTESGVRLTHRPTGVVATARDSRSQHRNRRTALRRLRARLRKKAKATQRKRRVPTRVPRREKRKRLEAKRKRSRKKELRKEPRPDD